MNDRTILALAVLMTGSCAVTYTYGYSRGLQKRKRLVALDDFGIDTIAILRASDVVNKRIEQGKISNVEDLRESVTNEIIFQRIAIREESNPLSD